MPGLAMPMPSSGRSASATSRQIRTTRLAAARPVLPLRSAVRRTTLAGEVDDGPDELVRLGEIEAQNVAAVGVDVDERRRLADTARRAQSELFDDAVVHQVANHRRHRCPSQSGDLRQVGPRAWPVAVQRPQQMAAVRTPGIFRRRHQFVCIVDKQIPCQASTPHVAPTGPRFRSGGLEHRRRTAARCSEGATRFDHRRWVGQANSSLARMRSRLPRTECGVIEHPLVEATWLLSQGDQARADPADLRGHEVGGIEAPPVGGDALQFGAGCALSNRVRPSTFVPAPQRAVSNSRFAGRNSLARLAAHVSPHAGSWNHRISSRTSGSVGVGHCERGAAEERSSTPGL